VQNSFVGPGYFGAIGARLERGRDFTPADHDSAPPVVAVNQTAARRLWPGEDPLGKRLRVGVRDDEPWREVVAIVADMKVNTPGEDPTPQLYFPVLQRYEPSQTLLVRTAGDPGGLLPALRRTVTEVNPDVGIVGSGLLADRVAAGLWPARFAATLLTALGLTGLAIASLGLYGSVAHVVSQRTRELGIRMALGAHRGDVVALVLRGGMGTVGVGLGIGVALAAAASRLLHTFLYGVSPWDPAAFLAAPLALALVGLAAWYLPARRATRVDPVEALRSE
jgi:predicted permease